MGVGGGDAGDQRQALGIGQDVELGARFAPVDGVRPDELAPVTFFVAPRWGSRSPGLA